MNTIIHIDINSCYASIERAETPLLRDKIIAVAGDENKRNGVILTASYEARQFGIKAGMPNRQALQLCPSLILVKSNHTLYKEYSDKVMDILRTYTYRVEQFSIDEAWVDISDIIDNNTTPQDIAFKIKERIKQELNITVSIGISFCKMFAKLGSDLAPQDSIFQISYNNFKSEIWNKNVKELMGVGNRTREKLNNMNIFTIGDLAKSDPSLIKAILKKPGETLWRYANGLDNAPVQFERSHPKSIGNSHTSITDIHTLDDAKKMLLVLSEQVGERLRSISGKTCNISITLKTNTFTTITRQRKISANISSTNRIYREAALLLMQNWSEEEHPIRQLGLSLSNLTFGEEQLSFFTMINDREVRDEKIDLVCDSLNIKFSRRVLCRCSSLSTHAIYK